MDKVTRRDLFAMAALQGLLACPTTRIKAQDLADQCYQIADAMLFESTDGAEGKPWQLWSPPVTDGQPVSIQPQEPENAPA